MLMHRKILTWEIFLKRGFFGPSRCPLYEKDEETMNHILNECEWNNNLWEWLKEIFTQTDRTRNSIQDCIANWRKNYSSCDMVNTLWQLCPGFILWSTWKERRKYIFKKGTKQLDTIKTSIMQNLKETALTNFKDEQATSLSRNDSHILMMFGLTSLSCHNVPMNQPRPTPSLDSSQRPVPCF